MKFIPVNSTCLCLTPVACCFVVCVGLSPLESFRRRPASTMHYITRKKCTLSKKKNSLLDETYEETRPRIENHNCLRRSPFGAQSLYFWYERKYFPSMIPYLGLWTRRCSSEA